MATTTRFSLRPIRTRSGGVAERSVVLDRGHETAARMSGTHLLRQFEFDAGYVVVTDFGRPRDEVTTFCLIDKNFRVLSQRKFGGRLSSWLLSEVRWVDGRRFRVTFHGSEILMFRIRNWGVPGLIPQLAYERSS